MSCRGKLLNALKQSELKCLARSKPPVFLQVYIKYIQTPVTWPWQAGGPSTRHNHSCLMPFSKPVKFTAGVVFRV